MKKCPYCAEKIQDAALLCRYCGKELPILSPGKEKPVPNNLKKQEYPQEKLRRFSKTSFFLAIFGLLLSFPIYLLTKILLWSIISLFTLAPENLVYMEVVLVFLINFPLWSSIVYGIKFLTKTNRDEKRKWKAYSIIGLIIDLLTIFLSLDGVFSFIN